MQTVTTIFFDIAKSVFQVHGVDAIGPGSSPPPVEASPRAAFFEKLPPCLVPGGACTHWKAPPLHGAHLERTFTPNEARSEGRAPAQLVGVFDSAKIGSACVPNQCLAASALSEGRSHCHETGPS